MRTSTERHHVSHKLRATIVINWDICNESVGRRRQMNEGHSRETGHSNARRP